MERMTDLIILILLLTWQQTSRTKSEKVARSVSGWYSQYHDLTGMNKKLNELNSTFDNAFLFSIGKTSEGRDMMALKITGAKKVNKPLFYTQCLIHPREWVSGSMCLYMADELTKNYGVDYKITALLDKMDFVILPVANPDGYAYSWYMGGKNDYTRLWVKNRRRVSRRCHGVDLNRNFGYAFGHKIDEEPRRDPCSKTYIGPYAFSEPETRNIRDYLTSLGGNLKGFIDFRAKGRSWHYPWKYTYEDSADKKEQKRAAVAAVRTIYFNGGYYSSYMSHSAGLGIQDGGTCMDWVYGQLGVKYSFTVKLQNRYGGSDGYKLRPAFIPATVKEAFLGVKTLCDAMNV